jgi:hypothetical protein
MIDWVRVDSGNCSTPCRMTPERREPSLDRSAEGPKPIFRWHSGDGIPRLASSRLFDHLVGLDKQQLRDG